MLGNYPYNPNPPLYQTITPGLHSYQTLLLPTLLLGPNIYSALTPDPTSSPYTRTVNAYVVLYVCMRACMCVYVCAVWLEDCYGSVKANYSVGFFVEFGLGR